MKITFLWSNFQWNWGCGFESQTFLVFFKPFLLSKTLKKLFYDLILTKTILWNHQITKMKNIFWYPRPHCDTSCMHFIDYTWRIMVLVVSFIRWNTKLCINRKKQAWNMPVKPANISGRLKIGRDCLEKDVKCISIQ